MTIQSGLFMMLVLLTSACSQPGSQEEAAGEAESSAVMQLKSGLGIEILDEGTGVEVDSGDLVAVHYTGTLKSTGEVFDSSYERGKPFEFPVGKGRVIKGWDEGIAKLRGGAKAKLDIPANLAYGSRANGKIPANSDLIFEVEVVTVHKRPKPKGHVRFDTTGIEAVTTNSGLKYYIIEAGQGPAAEVGKMAKVHYAGYFKDGGQQFDGSFDRGVPFDVAVGKGMVIPGWDEGISLLHEGTKAVLVIPSYLAYGERGYPDIIPPNADLIFDVQVVSVK